MSSGMLLDLVLDKASLLFIAKQITHISPERTKLRTAYSHWLIEETARFRRTYNMSVMSVHPMLAGIASAYNDDNMTLPNVKRCIELYIKQNHVNIQPVQQHNAVPGTSTNVPIKFTTGPATHPNA